MANDTEAEVNSSTIEVTEINSTTIESTTFFDLLIHTESPFSDNTPVEMSLNPFQQSMLILHPFLPTHLPFTSYHIPESQTVPPSQPTSPQGQSEWSISSGQPLRERNPISDMESSGNMQSWGPGQLFTFIQATTRQAETLHNDLLQKYEQQQQQVMMLTHERNQLKK